MFNWKRNSHKRFYDQKEIITIYYIGEPHSESGYLASKNKKLCLVDRCADGSRKVGLLLYADEDKTFSHFPPDCVEILKKLKKTFKCIALNPLGVQRIKMTRRVCH